jgi:hypothetical protein
MGESEPNLVSETNSAPSQTAEESLILDWMGSFLKQVDEQLPPETRAGLVKPCSAAHYRSLNMDETLRPFKGDLPGFVRLLTETWGWKIEMREGGRLILADENKDTCVCPLIRRGVIQPNPTLCSCSEGFAERMFASVLERPVSAKVVRSILRGGPSCIYQIAVEA